MKFLTCLPLLLLTFASSSALSNEAVSSPNMCNKNQVVQGIDATGVVCKDLYYAKGTIGASSLSVFNDDNLYYAEYQNYQNMGKSIRVYFDNEILEPYLVEASYYHGSATSGYVRAIHIVEKTSQYVEFVLFLTHTHKIHNTGSVDISIIPAGSD